MWVQVCISSTSAPSWTFVTGESSPLSSGTPTTAALVHETLDQALAANPDAHPLFHSDRGFQYTTRVFHDKLAAAGMTQSMSRVGKCIDNGPMEGFWGILKRERYYGRKFTSREQLGRMIREYIAYYNFSRLQRRLGIHTPMEVFTQYKAA